MTNMDSSRGGQFILQIISLRQAFILNHATTLRHHGNVCSAAMANGIDGS